MLVFQYRDLYNRSKMRGRILESRDNDDGTGQNTGRTPEKPYLEPKPGFENNVDIHAVGMTAVRAYGVDMDFDR